jgi:hypothetical protein
MSGIIDPLHRHVHEQYHLPYFHNHADSLNFITSPGNRRRHGIEQQPPDYRVTT